MPEQSSGVDLRTCLDLVGRCLSGPVPSTTADQIALHNFRPYLIPTMRQWLRIAFPKNYLDRRNRAGFLFVLPALLFFGSVFILPLAESIRYSFYKIAPGGAKEFAGLSRYEKVLTDPTFWTAVGNTVQLLLLSVPTTGVLALS